MLGRHSLLVLLDTPPMFLMSYASTDKRRGMPIERHVETLDTLVGFVFSYI